jgi:hypothetical protein
VVVTRAKALIALMLAVLWLPVTMHCALEGLPGLEFLICCDHAEESAPHEDDDCETDACAVVESGFYKLQDHDDLLVVFAEIVFGDVSLTADEPRVTASRPPPDVAVGWQFSSRAAPLPRAPSYLL